MQMYVQVRTKTSRHNHVNLRCWCWWCCRRCRRRPRRHRCDQRPILILSVCVLLVFSCTSKYTFTILITIASTRKRVTAYALHITFYWPDRGSLCGRVRIVVHPRIGNVHVLARIYTNTLTQSKVEISRRGRSAMNLSATLYNHMQSAKILRSHASARNSLR